MTEPRFQKGDEVVLISQRDQVGVIIRQPRLISGEWWYKIRFGAISNSFPESDLERYIADYKPFGHWW